MSEVAQPSFQHFSVSVLLCPFCPLWPTQPLRLADSRADTESQAVAGGGRATILNTGLQSETKVSLPLVPQILLLHKDGGRADDPFLKVLLLLFQKSLPCLLETSLVSSGFGVVRTGKRYFINKYFITNE